jgi:cyclic pyranopterin monophosphate synthase
MKKLTHTNSDGKAIMVDIGNKDIQSRTARARGHILLGSDTIKLILQHQIKKGDVFTVAQMAGINAAKQTQNLIPLCHNLLIENVSISVSADSAGVIAECEVKSTGKTGVEMEALTAVSVALLTVYDMCKAVDKNMVIDKVELVEKIKK